jgi:hypothetical protein
MHVCVCVIAIFVCVYPPQGRVRIFGDSLRGGAGQHDDLGLLRGGHPGPSRGGRHQRARAHLGGVRGVFQPRTGAHVPIRHAPFRTYNASRQYRDVRSCVFF